jgi:DNA modification methylase
MRKPSHSKARVAPVTAEPAPPWVVLQGDVVDRLATLADDSVDCVVTSPPYYWQRDYGVDGQIGHEPTIEAFVDALRDAFRAIRRVLKGDGTVFLNLGDTYYSAKGRPHGRDDKHHGRMMARERLRAVDGPGLGLPRKSLIGIPWRVALAMQDDGWTLRSDIVWRRPGSMPEPTAKDRPWTTHEHVFLFSKSPRYFFDRAGLEGEEDIWHIVARPDNPGSHFAPFPAALAERCVRCGCRPGGVVLDPFAGSGTTLVAARSLRRASIGIELSPAYAAFIEERMRSPVGLVAPVA